MTASGRPLKAPPKKYRVKIIVSPMDNPDVQLSAEFEDIARDDIMAPGYKVEVVTRLVKHLEYYTGCSHVDPASEAK